MNPQQAAELRKLAEGLTKVPQHKFDMRIWGKGKLDTQSPEFHCNYAGCAIGWLPKLVPETGLRLERLTNSHPLVPSYQYKYGMDAIREYFDMKMTDCVHLFSSHAYLEEFGEQPSPRVVADRILEFLEQHDPPGQP